MSAMINKEYSYIEERKDIVIYHPEKKVRLNAAIELLNELKEILRFDLIEEIFLNSKDKEIKEIAKKILIEKAEKDIKIGPTYFSSLYHPKREIRKRSAKSFIRECKINHDYKTIKRAYLNSPKDVKSIFEEALTEKIKKDAILFDYDEENRIPTIFSKNSNYKNKLKIRN